MKKRTIIQPDTVVTDGILELIGPSSAYSLAELTLAVADVETLRGRSAAQAAFEAAGLSLDRSGRTSGFDVHVSKPAGQEAWGWLSPDEDTPRAAMPGALKMMIDCGVDIYATLHLSNGLTAAVRTCREPGDEPFITSEVVF